MWTFLSNALTSINRCSCKHEHIIFGTNSDIKNFYKHNFDKNVVDFSGDIATSMRQIITSINSKFPNLIKDLKDLEKFAKNINQIEDCNLQNILRNKKIRNQLFKTNLKKDEMEMTKSLLRYILLLGCAGNIIAVPEYAKCSTNQSWGSKGDHIYNKLTTIKETLEKSTTDKKNQKAWQKFIKEYQNQNKSSKGNEYTFEKFIVDNLFIDYYDNKTRKILSKEKEHSGFNKLESTEEWTKWLDINSKLIIERAYRIKLSKEINRSLAFRSMRQCNNVKNLRNIFKYLDFINYNEIV